MHVFILILTAPTPKMPLTVMPIAHVASKKSVIHHHAVWKFFVAWGEPAEPIGRQIHSHPTSFVAASAPAAGFVLAVGSVAVPDLETTRASMTRWR